MNTDSDPQRTGAQPPTAASGLDVRGWPVTDRIVGGATFVLFISLFLPWFEYAGQTTNGLWHGFEYFTLIISWVIIGYLLLRASRPSHPLNSALPHTALLSAATGINFVLVLIGFLARPSASDLVITVTANWDFGAFLGLLAAFVAAAAVIGPRLRESIGHGI
jgi:hypothetical protein